MTEGRAESCTQTGEETSGGWGAGWGLTRSVYTPVALALPWLLLMMGMGDKNAAVLDAIRMVESGGQRSPPDGDGGLAIGPYQIHEIYWRDAVEFDPELLRGTYQDCRDREYAEAVVRAYMRRWVLEAWRKGDAEVIARTHNGGPEGAGKTATDPYWEKVRKHLR
jgi:hypothetical protein